MTEFLDVDGGRIAYDVTGEGPLVVLGHGMGTPRDTFRFLVPLLVAAGYRVANVDSRGHGESSSAWPSYTRTNTAHDLLALIRHLGGPAVIVGHSFAGGSATIAAAEAPEQVTSVVEICPFTRVAKVDLGALIKNSHHRKGVVRLLGTAMTGSIGIWSSYLDRAYPGAKPADYAANLAAVQANMREKGRMLAARKMGMSKPSDAQAQLPNISCPALVVMGTLDPDWPNPKAEAEAIVAAMPAGLGRVAMIEGAGHYPQAQFPDQVAAAIVSFLAANARA
ncbi:MAG: alpha/beta fold hydrolase [Acidothermaceae bacterium]